MLIKDALIYGKNYLSDSSPSPFLDTLLLLSKITDLKKEKILLDSINMDINNNLFDKFCFLLEKRKKNMPVQYLINHAEFMGLDFYVDQNVLIPRADTEILVESAIKFIKDQQNKFKSKKIKILDLCSGSGCISIALKKFCPEIKIMGIDISNKAVDISKKNALTNNVRVDFICADIFKKFIYKIPQDFDIIISNPPYIPSEKILFLGNNVKNYEPKIALDGGYDGLIFYKFISRKIFHTCRVFFEIGFDQSKSVSQILCENKFINIKVIKDLAGHDRVITAIKE